MAALSSRTSLRAAPSATARGAARSRTPASIVASVAAPQPLRRTPSSATTPSSTSAVPRVRRSPLQPADPRVFRSVATCATLFECCPTVTLPDTLPEPRTSGGFGDGDGSSGPDIAGFGITVRLLDGGMFNVAVRASDRVKDVMDRIQERTGVHPDNQRLVYKSRQLNAWNTLTEARVVPGDMLTMVTRLRGGV